MGAPDDAARGERLQKQLAAAGLGSRREIEEWIRAGRVQIDGVPAVLGARVLPGAEVRLDGQIVRWAGSSQRADQGTDPGASAALPATREVLIYHKPLGEMTTRSDPQGRPTVFERLPPPRGGGRWVAIGRLDVNTTGLLLFTTDGELAHRWMHPSGQIEREYLVRVRGQPAAADLARLRQGLLLADGPARFGSVEPVRDEVPGGEGGRGGDGREGGGGAVVDDPGSGAHRWFRVALREGRNREVRRLWQAAGYEVSRLKRLRYGSVRLPEDLRPGQWRWLPPGEAAQL